MKTTYNAIRHGKIHGFRVSRNPIMWIPFFLNFIFVVIPLALVGILCYPLILLMSIVGVFQLNRKLCDFDLKTIFREKGGRPVAEWKLVEKIEWRFQGIGSHYQVYQLGRSSPHIVVLHDTKKHDAFEVFARDLGITVDGRTKPIQSELDNA